MKRKMKKLLSALLVLVMAVGLLPATALAAENYDVWVGGVRVNGLNAGDVLGDGTVVFTPATESEDAKLTLNNAKITGAPVPAWPQDSIGIYSETDLILELSGSSTVTAGNADADSEGIFVLDSLLTITGSGTLEVTSGKGEYSAGISADTLYMLGGTVRAISGEALFWSEAVFSYKFVMEGGTLEAKAGKGEYCYAVNADALTVRHGTVRATVDEPSDESYAVYSINILMEGGTLEATVGEADFSCAVCTNMMTVHGGTVRAISGDSLSGSDAIDCESLVMEGGTLEATSGKGEFSSAIEVNALTMLGGTIRATGGKASEENRAVFARDIDMKGGTLEAAADRAKYTYGVYVNHSITMSGGTIRATGGDTTEESYAAYFYNFVMEGGTLIATGGSSPNSYGIMGAAKIERGTVTASGQTLAYYNSPDLSDFKDPVVTVSGQAAGTGAAAWNGTDALGGDDSGFQYVKIATYNPFTDVPEGQYYYDPVLWAIAQDPQVTTGTSATTFSPGSTCTRGQVVTFLWRALGAPEPTLAINPFTDVKADQYYYKAVLWAVENGITTGTSATTFSPNSGCTRGQVVTFLHRTYGSPLPGSAVNPFTDVPAGQYYYDAVLWAVNHSPQITNGTSATTFSPNATCTRGQIVTFIYRALN